MPSGGDVNIDPKKYMTPPTRANEAKGGRRRDTFRFRYVYRATFQEMPGESDVIIDPQDFARPPPGQMRFTNGGYRGT